MQNNGSPLSIGTRVLARHDVTADGHPVAHAGSMGTVLEHIYGTTRYRVMFDESASAAHLDIDELRLA